MTPAFIKEGGRWAVIIFAGVCGISAAGFAGHEEIRDSQRAYFLLVAALHITPWLAGSASAFLIMHVFFSRKRALAMAALPTTMALLAFLLSWQALCQFDLMQALDSRVLPHLAEGPPFRGKQTVEFLLAMAMVSTPFFAAWRTFKLAGKLAAYLIDSEPSQRVVTA